MATLPDIRWSFQDGTCENVRDWFTAIIEYHKELNSTPEVTQQALARMQWNGQYLFNFCKKFKPARMEEELRELGFAPELAKVVTQDAIALLQLTLVYYEQHFNKERPILSLMNKILGFCWG